jgi:hypothetical protein
MNRRVILAVVAVILLVALVPIGRWEARRQTATQQRGLAHIFAAVGPLGGSTLVALRPWPTYTCLSYRRGTLLLSLEICFDGNGRLIEASDRRGDTPRVYTLLLDRYAPTIVVPPARIALLARRVRRTILQSAWRGPARYLALCAAKARTYAPDAARICAAAAPVVAEDAASAEAAGSPTVARAVRSIADLLRRYAAAIERGPTAFEQGAPALEQRGRDITATLHRRAQWLRVVAPLR